MLCLFYQLTYIGFPKNSLTSSLRYLYACIGVTCIKMFLYFSKLHYLSSICLSVKTNIPAIVVCKFTINKFRTSITIKQVFYILHKTSHIMMPLNTQYCSPFTSIDVDSGISLRIITDRITFALTLVPVSSICKHGESVEQDNSTRATYKHSILLIASTISVISVVSFFIWLKPATVCIATNWSSSICDTGRE